MCYKDINIFEISQPFQRCMVWLNSEMLAAQKITEMLHEGYDS